MKLPKPEKLPSGSWHCRVTVDGEVISITKATEKEVIAEAAAIKAGKKLEKKKKAESITLREAIDRYIQRREKRSPSTIRGYRTIQRNRFQSVMDLPLRKLTGDILQDAINAETVSGKTIHNSWMLISSAMHEAGADVPNVVLPDVVSPEQEFLTSSEIPLFLQAIRGDRNELAALLALHSITRSEILDISRKDIDLPRDIIHIRGAAVYDENGCLVHKITNKNKYRRRDVPIMIPRLREMLENILSVEGDPDDYICNVSPNSIQICIDRACKKAGLPLVGCHGLRHSFASLALVHVGLSEDLTRRLGGWADPKIMHRIYTHVAQEELTRAASAMSSFYESETNNETSAESR